MEKVVNGQKIELDDTAMELFELSIIGSHTRKKLDNLITSRLDIPTYTRPLVENFCIALRKLPDALMATCCTLKYAVVAREMRRMLQNKGIEVPKLLPCNHGILVISPTAMHIVLQERTWALAANTADDKVNSMDTTESLDMETYKDEKFYKYFKYADDILEENKKISNQEFITYALPQLSEAAHSPNLLRWELSKLFIFEQYNDIGETKLREDCLVDIKNDKAFFIKPFWTGNYINAAQVNPELGKILTIDTREYERTGKAITTDEIIKTKAYDYKVDVISSSGLRSELIKSKPAFKNLFNFMVKQLADDRTAYDITLTGLIDDRYILAQIDDKIVAGTIGGQSLVMLSDGGKILNLEENIATIAFDVQNQLNQVNVRTILNYDIEKKTSVIAAKLFSSL